MANLKGKVALVVDDESDQIEFLSAILNENQMKTISASNGKEAIERTKESKLDVILLDMMMPEQSGMKFFNELKKSEKYRNIPVVIVSGASEVTGVDLKSIIYDKKFKERKKMVFGTDATPDAYLEKPVDPVQLVEIIEKLISD